MNDCANTRRAWLESDVQRGIKQAIVGKVLASFAQGHGFVQWYNGEHRHSAIRYVTPNQRHPGEEQGLLKRREAVYNATKQRNPQRWSGKTRN